MRAARSWVGCLVGAVLIGFLLAGAIFVYAAYVAGAAVPTRPLVTISETIPASAGVAGQPLVVFGQADDPDGIAEVALWVNGQQAGSQNNPDQTSLLAFTTSQAWIPNAAGNYLIVLKAADRNGFAGESEPMIIQVQERGYIPDLDIEAEYIVQDGDTLESIAASFGTTPDELRALNPDL